MRLILPGAGTGYLADDADAQTEAWRLTPMVGARGAAMTLELAW